MLSWRALLEDAVMLQNQSWVWLSGYSKGNLLTPGCGEGKCSVYRVNVEDGWLVFETPQTSWGFEQNIPKGQVRVSGLRVCDQLVHSSLISWWWSILRLQKVWGLCAHGHQIVNFFHLMRVLTSVKQLRKCASDSINIILVLQGPSSQGYSFSSGYVWMWELDYKESWALKNWCFWTVVLEEEMAPHSSTLAWKIPWMEEPGRLQSMGSLRVRHDWATSLSLFSFMHWRRKWQPTPVLLPGESQGQGSLVGCCLWGRTESDMTEVT